MKTASEIKALFNAAIDSEKAQREQAIEDVIERLAFAAEKGRTSAVWGTSYRRLTDTSQSIVRKDLKEKGFRADSHPYGSVALDA